MHPLRGTELYPNFAVVVAVVVVVTTVVVTIINKRVKTIMTAIMLVQILPQVLVSKFRTSNVYKLTVIGTGPQPAGQ